MGHALFRVMRVVMFDRAPNPDLDSLPLAQLRLLWTVRHQPDATMKDLSERLNVSRSTLTQLADRLVRRGLILRHTDPNDRRVIRLHASETGERLTNRDMAESRQITQAIWNAMTAEEQNDVMHGLEVLGRTAERVRAELAATPLSPTGDDPNAPVLDLMSRRVRGNG